jgi:general secretion pathway protein M
MILLARKERIVALVILALVILAAHAVLVAPLVALYDAREKRIEILSMRALRVAAQNGTGDEAARQLATVESSGQARAIFWPGATEAVAAATLQEQMRALLAEAGAEVQSTEALPPVADGNFSRIALKLRFSGDIDQVSRVVHGIETMKPALVIERLAIHGQNSTREDAPGLLVEMQLFGFAESGARKERKT